MRHSRLISLCLSLAALGGCGPVTPPPEPPHFLWSADPTSVDNPFPDQRIVADTSQRPRWYQTFLPSKAVTARSAAYFNKVGAQFSREVEGTGAFGGTLLPASEALDPDTVQGSIARLKKNASGGWDVLERAVPVDHLRDVFARRGMPLPEGSPEFLSTRPTVPLPEDTDGLLVVLAGPKTKSGVAFGRAQAWTDTKPDVSAVAQALGVTPESVLFTLPQHAPKVTAVPRALAAWANAHPPAATIPPHAVLADGNATRPVGKWTPADADWSELLRWLERHPFSQPAAHVGQVFIGELAARDLRDGSTISRAWTADPSQAPVVPLRFVLTLPSGPKPAGGWPVVMGAHGVNARNTPKSSVLDAYCLEWAEPLAAKGLGCIGIDAPEHGSRGNFTNFFSMDDLPAIRDRLREMTFDLLQVESALQTLDVDGDGQPDVAPRVRYFGNSLGAIMGGNFVPVSNRVSTAVLNVPGGGLSNVVMSQELQDLIGLLIVAQTDLAFDSPEYVASFPLFRAVAQPLFDPGDPITQAQAARPEMAVLLQEGVGDRTIPNDTSRDLAAALKLSVPPTDATHAFVEVDPTWFRPAAQLQDYNAHGVIWDFAPVREEAMTFLGSDGATLLMPR
ncbi:MAG: hypothetical protein U0228_06580 [Myxococcaceae bacterium]